MSARTGLRAPQLTAEHAAFDREIASLSSAELLGATPSHRPFVYWVVGLFAAFIAAMFLPWQQNVQAKGELTALSPGDRPQVVPTVIGGRIAEWYVQEGQYVRKGAPIVRVAEVKDAYLDPGTLDRYGEQVSAKQRAIGAKEEKVRALATQIAALEQGLTLSLEKGRNKVAQYEAAVQAAVLDSAIADDQHRRREALNQSGLSSLNDLQAARLKWQQNAAKLAEKRAELLNAKIELSSVRAEYGDKIAKARAERSATTAEVGEGAADVAKLRNAYDNLAVRNTLYRIDAPQDGYVVQALRAGVGEQVKEGESIVTIMPARPRQAVAVYVKAMDVPLLSTGRKVRLQFDGWPALQFAGWPSVSVGTFGGQVAVIDRVSQPDGTYRVLVTADPNDDPWPAQLRQGSGVLGWAMLDEVSLGFELWRRLNGFPPSVKQPSDGASGGSKAKATAAK
ncbi:MAG: RND efflux system, membrane fusion protein [uncultured Gemmatimonadaceae bacterium]|uniref:RND efflux system, membrane fusion protein n=1 Tax=uncultured Gemmatimonadaceae bacterium TaxID=246130 RepID=A0A6J4L8G1_9BACT|nr:MAG: RND efflux system, membrane fusion protein [uncultured Gemmatimonadaceae bacterium]